MVKAGPSSAGLAMIVNPFLIGGGAALLSDAVHADAGPRRTWPVR